MAKYQILIVDDQRDVRSVLKAAVESLGSDFAVLDVPSGEEAQLELTTRKFDLLVADVVLPGISGLELLKRTRKRNPDLKVILITGTVEPRTRREVADAGADAFFLKPIDTADFLDTVERALGIVDSSAPLDLETSLGLNAPTESVSERLTSLRKDVDAITAVLLDDRGRVLARAGDLPDASAESNLFPSLMAAFSASERVAHFLGQSPPSDLLYFSGTKYDLFMAHVGKAYALLVIINPIPPHANITDLINLFNRGLKDLLIILTQMGVSFDEEQPAMEQDLILEEEDYEIEEGSEPELEALFSDELPQTFEAGDVNAFWDTFADDEAVNGTMSADALTYEQARRLGLAPEEDAE